MMDVIAMPDYGTNTNRTKISSGNLQLIPRDTDRRYHVARMNKIRIQQALFGKNS